MSRTEIRNSFEPLLRWWNQSQDEADNVVLLSQFFTSVLQLCFRQQQGPNIHKLLKLDKDEAVTILTGTLVKQYSDQEIDLPQFTRNVSDGVLQIHHGEVVNDEESYVFRGHITECCQSLTAEDSLQLFEISAALYNRLQVLTASQVDHRGVPLVSESVGERVAVSGRCLADAANDAHDPDNDFDCLHTSPSSHRRPREDRRSKKTLDAHLEVSGDSAFMKLSSFFDQLCNILRPKIPIPEDVVLGEQQAREFDAAAEQVITHIVIENTRRERTVHLEHLIVHQFIIFILKHRNLLANKPFVEALNAVPESHLYPDLLDNKAQLSKWIHGDFFEKLTKILGEEDFIFNCCEHITQVYNIRQLGDDGIRGYVTSLCEDILKLKSSGALNLVDQVKSSDQVNELRVDEIKNILLQVVATMAIDECIVDSQEHKANDNTPFGRPRSGHDADEVLVLRPRKSWKRWKEFKSGCQKFGARFKRVPLRWKIAIIIGFVGGVAATIVLAVIAPPTLAVTLPTLGKVSGAAVGAAIGGSVVVASAAAGCRKLAVAGGDDTQAAFVRDLGSPGEMTWASLLYSSRRKYANQGNLEPGMPVTAETEQDTTILAEAGALREKRKADGRSDSEDADGRSDPEDADGQSDREVWRRPDKGVSEASLQEMAGIRADDATSFGVGHDHGSLRFLAQPPAEQQSDLAATPRTTPIP